MEVKKTGPPSPHQQIIRHSLVSLSRMTSLVLVLVVTSYTAVADFITSSARLQQLPFLEEQLLSRLRVYEQALPASQREKRQSLQSFIEDRTTQMKMLKRSSKTGWHPNEVYHLVKIFKNDWRNLIEDSHGFAELAEDVRVKLLPDSDDLSGACMAVVRLQQVYGLRVDDMHEGNYSGFLGPPLLAQDAYEIGKEAYRYGYLEESQQWLEKAAASVREQSIEGEGTLDSRRKLAQILGLLGRVHYFKKETQKAAKIYEDGLQIDAGAPELEKLKVALDSGGALSFTPVVRDYLHNMSILCSRRKERRVSELRPYHVCRYQSGQFVPYYRYREELLSTSPFVSLVYGFISDPEVKAFTDFAKRRLQDGLITKVPGSEAVNFDYRTSKLAWLLDSDLRVAERVSLRINAITGLDVTIRHPNLSSSAEPYQVVNYGLGGHYYPHFDDFDQDTGYSNSKIAISGNRLATALLYLSDVAIGGSTVFLKAGISVAPAKGTLLFWYNLDPSLERNHLTYHAGCPVIKGHKWIANKWIWTAGNFQRPCGRNPHSTHLDVEHFLFPPK